MARHIWEKGNHSLVREEESIRESRALQNRQFEARALEQVMASTALVPGIRNVEFVDDPLGKVIEVTTVNIQAAHDWRDKFGPSYGYLRIRIRQARGN